MVSVYVKCFATTRHNNTHPDVAAVTVMLNTVPIIADRIGDRDCAGGDGLVLAFFLFAAIADPVGSGF
jgi:hypothetical protein